MQAVIQAGGKGTRVSSITGDTIPKPMLEVSGYPILYHQIMNLKKSNIKDITIIIGHLGEVIKNYFKDGKEFGVNITYIEENPLVPLGTAGSLYYLKDKIKEDFVFLLCDVFIDIDFQKMFNFHRENNADVTLLTHPNGHPYDSDLVVEKDNVVTSFDHKTNDRTKYYYKNLVNAGANALMNEDDPDIGDETANEAIGAASNTVNTAKKAKNTYQTGKNLYNKYKQKRKAGKTAKKSGEAARKAGQTAKKAGEAIKKTTTVISKGVAKIASAIGASPAGVVILIGVGIFLLLFIFYAILEGSDIGYSSLDMKYGVTSDDAYNIFGNDDEYKLGMSTSEIDNIYDTKNHTLKCETGFFASLANVFGIYNLKNPCEFSTYIRNLTQNAERKYNITTISPGDLLSTLYYAYASQIVDDDGNNTIPTDSGKLDETDNSSISEFDAISILFSNGIYDKGDISDLLDNYILIKDKYPYYRYEKETTEETDDAGSDEEDTEEKYVCKEHTMANVVSEDKFKLYLRYGSKVSEEYEKVISYKEALNYTSSECTDDFYKKNGNLTDTDITKFKNVYVPNSDLIESESNLEEDTDREEKFAKAFINVNGINYTYEDGFIYKTYPRYDKKYTKNEIMHILASLENKSEHPLAKAIVKYYKIRKNPPLKEINDFEIISGKGVKGKIGNNEIVAGNKKLLNENYKKFEKTKVQHHLDAGATAIYLCMNNQLIGAVLLSDLLRNNAVDVILNLKSMNVTPVLMSGDNQNTTQTIASKVEIDNYKYNCLPEDKSNYIKELQLKK